MALKKFVGGSLPEKVYGRILAYGPTGVGKSTFGATMPSPRVVIATDANASIPLTRNYTDLPRQYQPAGEADRRPYAFFVVETWADAQEAIQEAARLAAKGKIRSVVFDSITAACEQIHREVLAARKAFYAERKRTIEVMDQQGYGLLKTHLVELRYQLHALPVHVCWLAGHVPPRYEVKNEIRALADPGGPDLPSQAAKLIPTACSAMLRLEKMEVLGGDPLFRVHSQPREDWVAKDNTGMLDAIEAPEAMVILGKMGFLTDDEFAVVRASVPEKSEQAKANAELGVLD